MKVLDFASQDKVAIQTYLKSVVTTNGDKSAEVIVPWWLQT